jgi:hypothetical protein
VGSLLVSTHHEVSFGDPAKYFEHEIRVDSCSLSSVGCCLMDSRGLGSTRRIVDFGEAVSVVEGLFWGLCVIAMPLDAKLEFEPTRARGDKMLGEISLSFGLSLTLHDYVTLILAPHCHECAQLSASLASLNRSARA